MKAFLKNYRQSPRKVRLVADLIRGKKASDALMTLSFVRKRGVAPLKKLLESAIANAKENDKLDKKDLFVKEIRVDKGITLKRFIPRAFGRATPINKRTSRINIVLGETKDLPKKKEGKVKAKADEAKKSIKKETSDKKEVSEIKEK